MAKKNHQEKNSSKQQKVLAVLIIAALILGFLVAKQKGLIQVGTQPSIPSSKALNSTAPVPGNLSSDEQALLHPPSADASDSAKQNHAQLVAKLAKPGTSLAIKDCKPTPLVLQLKQGDQFEVSNNDNAEHKLTFDEAHAVTIPANGKTTIKADFKYGSGDYGYVCEGLGLVGFLHITP